MDFDLYFNRYFGYLEGIELAIHSHNLLPTMLYPLAFSVDEVLKAIHVSDFVGSRFIAECIMLGIVCANIYEYFFRNTIGVNKDDCTHFSVVENRSKIHNANDKLLACASLFHEYSVLCKSLVKYNNRFELLLGKGLRHQAILSNSTYRFSTHKP